MSRQTSFGMRVTAIVLALAVGVLSQAAFGEVLYGVTETDLVTIDPSDPSSVSVVGPHSFPAELIPFDLAYDPVRGILFGMTTEYDFPHTRRFVRYDRQTGRGTVVALMGDQTTGLYEGIEFVGSRNSLVVGVSAAGS